MDAEEPTPTMERLLRTHWFLIRTASFLSFGDLGILSVANKDCHKRICSLIGSWPEDVQSLLRNWDLRTRLLLFGNHNTCQIGSDNMTLYRNPAPIVQFLFDSLGFDKKNDKLRGNPWKVLPVHNTPPSLGRLKPMVCPADDAGSKIFYCGGQTTTSNTASKWLANESMSREPSSATALLDVKTGTWRRLPPIPLAVEDAGICRIGFKIYIIGGELATGGDDKLLCFDLIQEKWLEPRFHAFPGRSYGGQAVVAQDDKTILVAGGEMIDTQAWRDKFVPLDSDCREAYSLNTTTGVWTRMTDLPASVEGGKSTGFLLKGQDNGEESIAVVCGNKWAQLLPSGEWRAMASLDGHGMTVFRLDSSSQNLIFTGKSWRVLPPNNETTVGSSGLQCLDESTDETLKIVLGEDTRVVATQRA